MANIEFLEERFGSGHTGLEYFFDPLFNWDIFAALVGWGNGCPRRKRNVERMGAEAYVREHLPQNIIWLAIVEQLAPEIKETNPSLYADLMNGDEKVGDNADYDPNCVPPSYIKNRRRGRMARDSIYNIVKAISGQGHLTLERLRILEETMIDPEVTSVQMLSYMFISKIAETE
jgi:hypothetical protein